MFMTTPFYSSILFARCFAPLPQAEEVNGVRGTRAAPSHPLVIEHRALAGAIAAQRAFLADCVGALKDPVLPRGEAREDFRFHRFRPTKPQIRFQSREA